MPSERRCQVLTLRARFFPDPPKPGGLMATKGGRRVLEVLEVERIGRAGDPRGHRYRLTCRVLPDSEATPGLQVRPWGWTAASEKSRPDPLQGPEKAISSDETKQRVRLARQQAEREAAERARRVGRDTGVQDRCDRGHSIQHMLIRDGQGHVLRPVELAVEEVRDPDNPKRRQRRARRSDPLVALRRAGSISRRGWDAGERYRRDLEGTRVPIRVGVPLAAGQGAQAGQPFISQVKAWTKVRRALAVVPPHSRAVLDWVVAGRGTITGYAAECHVCHSTASTWLSHALEHLADHYFGRMEAAA